MLSNAKDLNIGASDQEEWKKWSDDIKEEQKDIRRRLRDAKIYTNTWEELDKITSVTAKSISTLKIDPDDELDVFYKDIATAILAAKGDKIAAEFLVKRSTQDEDLIELFPIAGRSLVEPLRRELQNEESLIYNKGMAALKILFLEPQITDFYKSHPKLRQISEKDFKEEEKLIYKQVSIKNSLEDFPLIIFAFSDTFKKAKYDISACQLYLLPLEGTDAIVHITGYDPELRTFCSRFYLWKNLEWHPIKIRDASNTEKYELSSRRFVSHKLEINPAKDQIAISSPKVENTKSFRTEQVWNPAKYRDYYGNYSGGYDQVTREYNEPMVKPNWLIYDFSPEQRILKFIEERDWEQPFTAPKIPPSTTFSPGDYVRVLANAGAIIRNSYQITMDGSNKIAIMPKNAVARIINHPDNGIAADGYYWWYVQYGNQQGWCAESDTQKKEIYLLRM